MHQIIFKILNYLNKHKNIVISTICVIAIITAVISISSAISFKQELVEQEKIAEVALNKSAKAENKNNELTDKVTEYENQIEQKDKEISDLKGKVEELSKKVTITPIAKPIPKDGNYNLASQLWSALIDKGLNKFVVAGIMGNIMAEVGGQTLDLSGWQKASQGRYYGICQWADGRKQRLLNKFGSSFHAQINFLITELFEVIPEGNSFYSMQNEKDAALYFARKYERCNSRYYNIRMNNATKALAYFG